MFPKEKSCSRKRAFFTAVLRNAGVKAGSSFVKAKKLSQRAYNFANHYFKLREKTKERKGISAETNQGGFYYEEKDFKFNSCGNNDSGNILVCGHDCQRN
jgi:hypothetical protein